MGDIGSAISGGANAIASVYATDRNIAMQRETNAQQYGMFKESNEFNATQADLNRSFQQDIFNQANEFGANEAQKNRDFQSSEADRSRQWTEDMYNSYQSPEALANQYQKLGITPASVLSGGGQMTTTSMPSGSQASPSGVSGAQASSAGVPSLTAPRIDNNPVSDFLSAFNQFELNQANVQSIQLKNEFQKQENRFQIADQQSKLRFRNAEIDKLIADKDVSKQTKDNLELEYQRNEIAIEILNANKEEDKRRSYLENKQIEENTRNIILKNSAQEMENKVLPKMLSSQMNLNNSQAKAALKSADAAMESALAVKYDSQTKRMVYELDKRKYEEVYKANVEAQTNFYNNASEHLGEQAEQVGKQNDWYEADKIIGIMEFLLNQQTERLKALLGGLKIIK